MAAYRPEQLTAETTTLVTEREGRPPFTTNGTDPLSAMEDYLFVLF